jgi:hypothetical protein
MKLRIEKKTQTKSSVFVGDTYIGSIDRYRQYGIVKYRGVCHKNNMVYFGDFAEQRDALGFLLDEMGYISYQDFVDHLKTTAKTRENTNG